jgi:hypothetical protein
VDGNELLVVVPENALTGVVELDGGLAGDDDVRSMEKSL